MGCMSGLSHQGVAKLRLTLGLSGLPPTRMSENVLSLRPWDAALRRAKTRATDLLERPDAVGVLSPLEAYTAVKAIGPADASPVLARMTDEQVQTLWDLEAWQADRLSIDDVMLWLSSFREASVEAQQRAAAHLDFEALSALLRRRLLVALKPRDDRSEDDPVPAWVLAPSPEIEPLIETPDGRFIIAARDRDEDETALIDEIEPEDQKWILQLVTELYQQEDWEAVAAVLRSAANDLTSSLEETAYRFRSARLEDLGFPPRERAIEIYGLEDPGPKPLAAAPALDLALPMVYTPPLQQGVLHAALQTIEDPALMRRLEGDLVAVANKALVADGILPGQTVLVQEALHRLRGYVELALVEGVAPADRIVEAARRLREDHLERLFRIGYTLTVRAAGRARRLLARLSSDDDGEAVHRLSAAEQGVVEALLLKRPRISGALEPVVDVWVEDEGADPARLALDAGAAEARRPFASWVDLRAVRWALDELEAFVEAWQAQPPDRPPLPVDINLPAAEHTFDVLLTTALAQVLRDEAYAVRPLRSTELADLADGITLDEAGTPGFGDEARMKAVHAAGGLALKPRVQRLLRALAEQLWPHVGRDRVDPRFVDVVLTFVD